MAVRRQPRWPRHSKGIFIAIAGGDPVLHRHLLAGAALLHLDLTETLSFTESAHQTRQTRTAAEVTRIVERSVPSSLPNQLTQLYSATPGTTQENPAEKTEIDKLTKQQKKVLRLLRTRTHKRVAKLEWMRAVVDSEGLIDKMLILLTDGNDTGRAPRLPINRRLRRRRARSSSIR